MECGVPGTGSPLPLMFEMEVKRGASLEPVRVFGDDGGGEGAKPMGANHRLESERQRREEIPEGQTTGQPFGAVHMVGTQQCWPDGFMGGCQSRSEPRGVC